MTRRQWKDKRYNVRNNSNCAAVSLGFLTFGKGFTCLAEPSRVLRLMMAMIRSSDMKNSRSDSIRKASSKRSRCSSVQ